MPTPGVPLTRLPEMTLRWAAVVPPMRTLLALTRMPTPEAFGLGKLPLGSVPTQFDSMTCPLPPSTWMPVLLPLMTKPRTRLLLALRNNNPEPWTK